MIKVVYSFRPHKAIIDVHLRKKLAPVIRKAIIALLEQYKDVFAFGSSKMLRIALKVRTYKLSVDPNYKPTFQKWRHLVAERSSTATAEDQRLLEIVFVKECPYPKLMLNVLLVKEPNGTWRICVDFKDLNKA